MLLDSNIIIYAAQPEHVALRQFIELHAPAVSVVSYIEVLGYHKLKDDRQFLEQFFQTAERLPLGLKLLSLADNRRTFDRNDATSLHQSARAYVDFYIRTGTLGRLPDLDALIDPTFLPAE